MPKHIERTWVFPLPGAFGLEQSKVEWERRNRPNAHYLTRTGYYADKLYVYVSEEYGYASYLWVYPGTPEELVDDWCGCKTPFWGRSKYRGEFDRVSLHTPEHKRGLPYQQGSLQLVLCNTDEVIEGFSHISHFDGEVHIHEQDDSYLKIGFYEVHGIRPAEVTYLVLDALAAIR